MSSQLGRNRMDQKPPSRGTTIGLGAIAAALGLYIVLLGFGVLPPPGEANAPMWVVMLAGLCFLLGGLGVLLPAAVTAEVRDDGELPAGAPYWLRVFQYLLVLILFAAFATIGSFVAFGPGTRSFSVSLPFGSTSGGSEIVGRVAFGVGAVITWLCLILVAVSGWRKLVGRDSRTSETGH
jgi:hypothetical protein